MTINIHPQSQSGLLGRLPREILDQIYLEVWRSYGLRQHILFHGKRPGGMHFCRWECSTDYRVDDQLQADVENLRARLDVPFGFDIQGRQPPEIGMYCRRLMSSWIDHWPCGERAVQEHGIEAIGGYTTSDDCWKTLKNKGPDDQHVPKWSPFLPMLLTCKLMSDQCLKSIYESVTFIFTDPTSIQAWFGPCQLSSRWKPLFEGHCTPPAFHKYARSFELSLDPDFGRSFLCGFGTPENAHDGYDFHWLHLSRFKSLRTVNIWVGARSKMIRFDPKEIVFGIKELDANAFTKSLTAFSGIESLTISTPLGPCFKTEEGLVEDFTLQNVKLYKRGSGDRFHPWLNLVGDDPDDFFRNLIYTCDPGEVRLAINGGNHHVMREV